MLKIFFRDFFTVSRKVSGHFAKVNGQHACQGCQTERFGGMGCQKTFVRISCNLKNMSHSGGALVEIASRNARGALLDVAAVVGDQAFAFMVDGGMFDQLAVSMPGSGVSQACCTSV